MEYHITQPSSLLSKFIKHYWAIESCMPSRMVHTQRIIPSGLLELMFYLGNRPVATDTTKSINENTIITGHQKEFYDINISGKLSVFSISFKPHGLSMFFDIPLNELYNRNIPLKYLFSVDISELETKLFEAKSFTEKTQIIERYLLKRLNKSERKYDYNRIEHCVNIIDKLRGVVDIDFLASEACLSRKQFERTFSHYVGTSPKQFLKTIRFQHSLHYKYLNNSATLTDLSYHCGYYDQSHMINDFQKLSGLTPKQYFNTCEAYSDYFQ